MSTRILIPMCAAFALLAACGQKEENAEALTTPGTTSDDTGSSVQPIDPAGETSSTPGTTTTPDTPPTDPASPPPAGE
jgi:hypothetical protein